MDSAGVGSFDQIASIINNMIKTTDAIYEVLWKEHCEECSLREEPKDPAHGDAVKCKYPERINYINVDNCKYKWCPLIKRRGEHDV